MLTTSGVEDEGVAFEQPGELLVPGLAGALGAATSQAFDGHESCALGRLVELGVNTVDVGLLDRKLCREGVVGPRGRLGQVVCRRHRAPVLVTASIRSQVSVPSFREAGRPATERTSLVQRRPLARPPSPGETAARGPRVGV